MIHKYGCKKELNELDQFLSHHFDLFEIIEDIIENRFVCFKELHKSENQGEDTCVYSKSVFTLRKDLNEMANRKYLQKKRIVREKRKEPTTEKNIDNAHYTYHSTETLERLIVLMHNRLSALINKSFNLKEIKFLDVKLLEDLISRLNLYEEIKTAKALGTN